MAVHLLGIRHHGPGSCRNVVASLNELCPDLILLEGPAEADLLMQFVADAQMAPPVALLGYQPDKPQNAVFYPFAVFSPEWQTMRYAVDNSVPLRFFDLPLAYSMTEQFAEQTGQEELQGDNAEISDPFDYLAEIAGYENGEAWWEASVEHRKGASGIFQAVKEAVSALRDVLSWSISKRDLVREAWMRKMIRAAQKDGFERIAVVCGAWHVPALESMPKVKDDNELLKGLAKVKIECTWIPWTYGRLSSRSGYGAGIESPGWYDYLWHHPEDDGTLWVSHVASLLRQKGMDISVAHVIETVRLARATAALRSLPSPSLSEYNEAVTTVMGFGDDTLLQIVKESLIIGDRLGHVPNGVPKVPLLADVERIQKRLRVPFTAEIKELILDLRKPNDLERSIFFHRLTLLGVDWSVPGSIDGRGTFKEKWTLYHKPEQVVSIIEKAVWGNTVEEAVQKFVSNEADGIRHIPELTKLLGKVIPADLPGLVEVMTSRLDRLSAAASDIVEMMEAVPDLSGIVRYGNVRNLDFSRVDGMLHAMMARILAGGILVCINIDEEAAAGLLDKLVAVDYAVSTLNDSELNGMWLEFVNIVRTSVNVHPLLSGYAVRLLNDKGVVSPEEMQSVLSFYTSAGNLPTDVAYWFEGFLRASGTILLLDDDLWNLVNGWVCSLSDDDFKQLLPILRRTFSEFSPAERRKLGEKAKLSTDIRQLVFNKNTLEVNEADASRVLPLIFRLLGIKTD